MARTTAALLAVLLVGAEVGGQELHTARDGYFRMVGSYFRIAQSEVAILSDWDLPPDEIPVVLFIAQGAGVSPEALVALRRSGRSWVELADRYAIGARVLYLPLREGASAGALAAAYDAFRATPVGEWPSIRLAESDIVALVNIRVLSEALGVPVEEVFRQTSRASSFVELYELLVH
jgi:hypothetical protein